VFLYLSGLLFTGSLQFRSTLLSVGTIKNAGCRREDLAEKKSPALSRRSPACVFRWSSPLARALLTERKCTFFLQLCSLVVFVPSLVCRLEINIQVQRPFHIHILGYEGNIGIILHMFWLTLLAQLTVRWPSKYFSIYCLSERCNWYDKKDYLTYVIPQIL